VREAEGQFSFRGKNYSYARVFDYENDEAWVEIREADGKILYGKAVAHNHKQELLPMTKVIKNKGKSILAYRLGTPSNVIEQLIREQRIVPLDNGSFEIFSREVVEGGSEHGQLARSGDYIKVDSAGFPYPNDAAFFVENHRHISGDEYEQIPKPLDAWTAEQPMCSEVEYLIREKGLVLNESDSACYFSAPLWGTVEMAAKDAVLVFYSIDRAEDGTIRDADFNFVARDEFDKTYRFC
ncbi:MAG: hypothetical protein J6R05_01675, partial [Bacteroidaceae bacterium]|nr:hypothetical protein [Bacteroidaceae bacterium]